MKVTGYHGTAPKKKDNNSEKTLEEWAGIHQFNGPIQYFSEDMDYAAEFSKWRSVVNGMYGTGRTVVVVEIEISNPYDATKRSGYWKKLKKDPIAERDRLQGLGYDGVVFYEGVVPVKTWVTFSPDQLKILNQIFLK